MRAKGTDGVWSLWSHRKKATTSPPPTIPAIRIEGVGADVVRLAWDNIKGVGAYEMQRQDVGSADWIHVRSRDIDEGPVTTATIGDLRPGNFHLFRVRVTGNGSHYVRTTRGGETAWSDWRHLTVRTTSTPVAVSGELNVTEREILIEGTTNVSIFNLSPPSLDVRITYSGYLAPADDDCPGGPVGSEGAKGEFEGTSITLKGCVAGEAGVWLWTTTGVLLDTETIYIRRHPTPTPTPKYFANLSADPNPAVLGNPVTINITDKRPADDDAVIGYTGPLQPDASCAESGDGKIPYTGGGSVIFHVDDVDALFCFTICRLTTKFGALA